MILATDLTWADVHFTSITEANDYLSSLLTQQQNLINEGNTSAAESMEDDINDLADLVCQMQFNLIA